MQGIPPGSCGCIGCVYDDAWWYVSTAPVDSHLLPPPSLRTPTDTHTHCGNQRWQRKDVISSSARSISLYYTMSHTEVPLRQHLADHFKDVCFFSVELLSDFRSSGMTEFSVTSAYIRKDPQLHMPRICVFTCLFPDCKTHFRVFLENKNV